MNESWPPENAEPLVSFEVQGMPKPAGSKNAVPLMKWDPELKRKVPIVRKDTGAPIVNQVDSSGEAGKNWRTDIRAAAAAALDAAHELADGPLAVRVTFFYEGPASRFGTGRNAGVLKDSADAYPHASKLADGTKLGRALEDALTSIVWTDDRRVCDMWWSRRFGRTGARVDIFTLPRTVAQAGRTQALSLLGDSHDSSVIMGNHGDENGIAAIAS